MPLDRQKGRGWRVARGPRPEQVGSIHDPVMPPQVIIDKSISRRRLEWNAAYMREARRIWCRECGQHFVSDVAAAFHAAETGHVCRTRTETEIVRVCTDDDWTLWEDGAGRSMDEIRKGGRE